MESFVKEICKENNVIIISHVSHTLWRTEDILKANGGTPPVTYDVFCHVSFKIGLIMLIHCFLKDMIC